MNDALELLVTRLHGELHAAAARPYSMVECATTSCTFLATATTFIDAAVSLGRNQALERDIEIIKASQRTSRD